jgi:hypothetical protein
VVPELDRFSWYIERDLVRLQSLASHSMQALRTHSSVVSQVPVQQRLLCSSARMKGTVRVLRVLRLRLHMPDAVWLKVSFVCALSVRDDPRELRSTRAVAKPK